MALFDQSIVPALLNRPAILANPVFGGAQPAEDEAWDAVLAAEADLQRRLRVYLEPTVIVPSTAPQAEIDALETAGTRYALEAPYEYEPRTFSQNFFGLIESKQRPILSVESMKFVYPGPASTVFTVPPDWIRPDKKFGQVHLVPTGLAGFGPLNAFILQAITARKTVPMMIELRYTAGLSNVLETYPDVARLIKRMAVEILVQDAFPAQSGSISGDGLSRSVSVDTSKYAEQTEKTIKALRQAIRGLEMGVL